MIYICLILINNTFTMGNIFSVPMEPVYSDIKQQLPKSNERQQLPKSNYRKTAYATKECRIEGLDCVSTAIADFLYKNKETSLFENYLILTKKKSYPTTNIITIHMVSICDKHNEAQVSLFSKETSDTTTIDTTTIDTTYKTEDTRELCSVVEQGFIRLMTNFHNIFSQDVDTDTDFVIYKLKVYINKDNNTNKITIGPRGCLERIIS